MAIRISLRRDDSTSWSTENPILARGEPGYEVDTNLLRIGNGLDNFVNRPPIGFQSMGQILDVELTNLQDGEGIFYDAGLGKWVNQPSSGGASSLGELTDVTLSAPAEDDGLKLVSGEWVNAPASSFGLWQQNSEPYIFYDPALGPALVGTDSLPNSIPAGQASGFSLINQGLLYSNVGDRTTYIAGQNFSGPMPAAYADNVVIGSARGDGLFGSVIIGNRAGDVGLADFGFNGNNRLAVHIGVESWQQNSDTNGANMSIYGGNYLSVTAGFQSAAWVRDINQAVVIGGAALENNRTTNANMYASRSVIIGARASRSTNINSFTGNRWLSNTVMIGYGVNYNQSGYNNLLIGPFAGGGGTSGGNRPERNNTIAIGGVDQSFSSFDDDGGVDYTSNIRGAFPQRNNQIFFGSGGLGSGNTYLYTTVFWGVSGAMTMPHGSTAQRPGNPDEGMLRYNQDTRIFEGYFSDDGTATGLDWRSLGAGDPSAFVWRRDTQTGAKPFLTPTVEGEEVFLGASDGWPTTSNLNYPRLVLSRTAPVFSFDFADGIVIFGRNPTAHESFLFDAAAKGINSQNILIGTYSDPPAGRAYEDIYDSIAIGLNQLLGGVGSYDDIYIGHNINLRNTSGRNVLIGHYMGDSGYDGNGGYTESIGSTTAIGYVSLLNVDSAYSVVVGGYAAQGDKISHSTLIGHDVGGGIRGTATNVIAIGGWGYRVGIMNDPTDRIIIGQHCPYDEDNLIFIGHEKEFQQPSYSKVIFGASGSLRVPSGTLAERSTDPKGGEIRFNEDALRFEGYFSDDGTATGLDWRSIDAFWEKYTDSVDNQVIRPIGDPQHVVIGNIRRNGERFVPQPNPFGGAVRNELTVDGPMYVGYTIYGGDSRVSYMYSDGYWLSRNSGATGYQMYFGLADARAPQGKQTIMMGRHVYDGGTPRDSVLIGTTFIDDGRNDAWKSAASAPQNSVYIGVNHGHRGPDGVSQVYNTVVGFRAASTAALSKDQTDNIVIGARSGEDADMSRSMVFGASRTAGWDGEVFTNQIHFSRGPSANDPYESVFFDATGAMKLPAGDSTTQRPASPVDGMIRYASDRGTFEGRISGTWVDIPGSGGGGASTFLALIDTPSTWGTAGQFPVINGSGNGLEWVDPPNGGGGASTFLALTDTPSAWGTAGQFPVINGSGDGLDWVDAPSGGASTFLALTDTPSAWGTAGQFPVINGSGDGLDWVDAPSGGTDTWLDDKLNDGNVLLDGRGRFLYFGAADNPLANGSIFGENIQLVSSNTGVINLSGQVVFASGQSDYTPGTSLYVMPQAEPPGSNYYLKAGTSDPKTLEWGQITGSGPVDQCDVIPQTYTAYVFFCVHNVDNTGATDTLDELQAAIDQLRDEGRDIEFPPGEYMIGNTLHIWYPQTEIRPTIRGENATIIASNQFKNNTGCDHTVTEVLTDPQPGDDVATWQQAAYDEYIEIFGQINTSNLNASTYKPLVIISRVNYRAGEPGQPGATNNEFFPTVEELTFVGSNHVGIIGLLCHMTQGHMRHCQFQGNWVGMVFYGWGCIIDNLNSKGGYIGQWYYNPGGDFNNVNSITNCRHFGSQSAYTLTGVIPYAKIICGGLRNHFNEAVLEGAAYRYQWLVDPRSTASGYLTIGKWYTEDQNWSEWTRGQCVSIGLTAQNREIFLRDGLPIFGLRSFDDREGQIIVKEEIFQDARPTAWSFRPWQGVAHRTVIYATGVGNGWTVRANPSSPSAFFERLGVEKAVLVNNGTRIMSPGLRGGSEDYDERYHYAIARATGSVQVAVSGFGSIPFDAIDTEVDSFGDWVINTGNQIVYNWPFERRFRFEVSGNYFTDADGYGEAIEIQLTGGTDLYGNDYFGILPNVSRRVYFQMSGTTTLSPGDQVKLEVVGQGVDHDLTFNDMLIVLREIKP